MTNRRSFLKTTAVAAAATAAWPTILTSCSNWKGANDRIITAHVGVGSRGTNELGFYFLPHDEFRVAAVCDVFKNRREAAAQKVNKSYADRGIDYPGCSAFNEYEEVLNRKDIDLVAVTTSDHWHLPVAIAAARAGKHIHVNKPLGLSVEYMKALSEAVRDNKVQFNYGTQQRSYDFMKRAMEYIHQGSLGEIKEAIVWAPGGGTDRHIGYFKEQAVPAGLDYDRWLGPAPEAPYTDDRVNRDGSFFINDYSIGFLGGWGAHPLDIMVWGVKDRLRSNYSIEGSGRINWPEGSMYNNINIWDVLLTYNSGIKVRFLSQDLAKPVVTDYLSEYRQNGTLFIGSKGWLGLSRTYAESSLPEITQDLNSFPKKSFGLDGDRGTHGLEFAKLIRGEQDHYMVVEDAILSDLVSHHADAAIRLEQKLEWNAEAMQISNSSKANKILNRKHRSGYAVV